MPDVDVISDHGASTDDRVVNDPAHNRAVGSDVTACPHENSTDVPEIRSFAVGTLMEGEPAFAD